MIVTIDGPAGSGKSTAARKLAARLGIAYLDTGAMYRAIAHEVLRRSVDLHDPAALLTAARSLKLEVDCGPTHTRIRIDGHDVTEAIRTMAVSSATPYVASHLAIRELLVARQRELGGQLGSLVSDGRDQGSVVFPTAEVKFVLDASMEMRAERRHLELTSDGGSVTLQEVMDNLVARDRVDCVQWEPLLNSGRAIVLDTTELTIGEVVDQMAAIVDSTTPRAG